MSARKRATPPLRLLTFPARRQPRAGSTRAMDDPAAPVCEAARVLCAVAPKSFAFISGLMFDMLSAFDADQAAELRRAHRRVAGGER